MKLELKNFKFHEQMSEETNAYYATLHANGKKIAECRNNGQGGMTFINALPNCRDYVKDAEEFALTLPPPTDYPSLSMSLDFWCDCEAEKLITEKENAKNYRKGLCITKDKKSPSFEIVTWKGHTVTKMLKSEAGIKALKVAIVKYEAQGYFILNTNIPNFVTA